MPFMDDLLFLATSFLAPAGGATAANPEGGALACPSASPRLPVVTARNSVGVPSLARLEAKRADSAIRAISSCRESHVHGALDIYIFIYLKPHVHGYICTLPAPRSPARAVRCVFRGKILMYTVLLGGLGHVSQERVVARRVRPYQRWDAGVEVGGG
jgi:hypothetical protein